MDYSTISGPAIVLLIFSVLTWLTIRWVRTERERLHEEEVFISNVRFLYTFSRLVYESIVHFLIKYVSFDFSGR